MRLRRDARPRLRPARSAASTRSSPEDRFEAAVADVRGTAHEDDLVARLPQPLLRPARPARRRAGQAGAGRDELLHDRRRARRSAGSSPRRGFVHTVRDGRDAGSSKVSKRQKRTITRRRASEGRAGGRGACALAEARRPASSATRAGCTSISLDELVWRRPRGAPTRGLLELPRARRRAGDARLLRRGDERRRRPPRALARGARRGRAGGASSASYEKALDRLEARGLPLRRRRCAAAYERSRRGRERGAEARRERDLVFVGGTGRSGTHVARPPARPPLAASPTSRSRPASTATSAACRTCSRAGSRSTATSRSCAASGGTGSASTASRAASTTCCAGPTFDAAARALRGRLPRRPGRAPAASSSSTCSGRSPTSSGKPGLVEMCSHNVRRRRRCCGSSPRRASSTRVRDGRDSAASVTGKTWGPGSIGAKAIDWWAERLRAIEAGVRGEEDGAGYSTPARPLPRRPARRPRRPRARARLRRAARLPRRRGRAGDPRASSTPR